MNSEVFKQKANTNTIFFLYLNSNSQFWKLLILPFEIISLQVHLPSAIP